MSQVFQVPKGPEPLLFMLEEDGDVIELPPFVAFDDERMASYIALVESDEGDMAKVSRLAHILNPALDGASVLQKQWVIARWNEQNRDSMGEFLASSEP